jgi:hypothetical protein
MSKRTSLYSHYACPRLTVLSVYRESTQQHLPSFSGKLGAYDTRTCGGKACRGVDRMVLRRGEAGKTYLRFDSRLGRRRACAAHGAMWMCWGARGMGRRVRGCVYVVCCVSYCRQRPCWITRLLGGGFGTWSWNLMRGQDRGEIPWYGRISEPRRGNTRASIGRRCRLGGLRWKRHTALELREILAIAP